MESRPILWVQGDAHALLGGQLAVSLARSRPVNDETKPAGPEVLQPYGVPGLGKEPVQAGDGQRALVEVVGGLKGPAVLILNRFDSLAGGRQGFRGPEAARSRIHGKLEAIAYFRSVVGGCPGEKR